MKKKIYLNIWHETFLKEKIQHEVNSYISKKELITMEISGIERKIIFFKKRIEDFYEKENKLELKKKSKPENYKIKRKIEFVKESCELEKKYMEKWIFNLSQTNHELNKINELIEIKMS